jgi:hypothetical protein
MVKLFKYNISTLEIIVFVAFIVYLIFNVQTPSFLIGTVDSPVGVIVLMLLVLYLFIYTNPILGILGLFVAYEMIRRSSMMVSGKVPMIQYTPTQIQKERQMSEMNIPKAFEQPMMHQEPMFQDRGSKNQDDSTLEVEMVQSMAPLMNAPSGYVETAFKPVMENVHNASLA